MKEYQKALDESGYNHKLKFMPPKEKANRQRSRNITFYNPPFSSNVTTNIGKEFFKLLDQNFPIGHVLHPIINRNTVKLSYSCLPNVEKIIAKHIRMLLKSDENPNQCNCGPELCPVNGECQTTGIVYKATLTTAQNEIFKYVGLSEGTFKDRYRQHQSNFRTRNKKNKTNLSEKVWDLEDRNVDFEIKWEILQRAIPYQAGSDDCQLCLAEIFDIIYHPEEANLNSRNEFINKCRHKNKFMFNYV